jgi:hypothetical protein
MRIFVSIASYRDPQLAPTVEDCLAKARWPENLRFGVCRQFGPEEPQFSRARDGRFRVIDVDWRESRGACWARHQVMRLYDGEDYYLQLDSHHRFAVGWDALALEYLSIAGGSRPLLTTYATPFQPGPPETLDPSPMQINFDRFTEDGMVLCRPGAIPSVRGCARPRRARFLSAHFLFTIGRFVQDVPYDPDLYFIGEEISLAIRAFTHGYDLFHPHQIVVWHEYTRDYRPNKHWSDHVKENGVTREWFDLDRKSKEKVKLLLSKPRIGKHGLGSVRTLEDYESYAGIDFQRCKVQDYTRRDQEPPNPAAEQGWAERTRRYRVVIPFDRRQLLGDASDYLFWYVGIHDAMHNELHREDLPEIELRALLASAGRRMTIIRELESCHEPVSWTIWPYSRSLGWLKPYVGPVRLGGTEEATT